MNAQSIFEGIASRHEDTAAHYLAMYDREKEDFDITLAIHHRQVAHEIRQALNQLLRLQPSAELVGCQQCGALNHYSRTQCSDCNGKINGFF